MLGEVSSSNGMVSSLPSGAPNPAGSMLGARGQYVSKQSLPYKGTRGFAEGDELEAGVSNNLFMQDQRIAHSLNRGHAGNSAAMVSENIFTSGNATEINNNNGHLGYINNKQLQAVATPNGFKQVNLVSAATNSDGFAFASDATSGKYGQGQFGSSNLRAKTMVPSVGIP